MSLDVLQTIVRSSSLPLSEALVNQAFPVIVHCILHTDDNSTLQVSDLLQMASVKVFVKQNSAGAFSRSQQREWVIDIVLIFVGIVLRIL